MVFKLDLRKKRHQDWILNVWYDMYPRTYLRYHKIYSAEGEIMVHALREDIPTQFRAVVDKAQATGGRLRLSGRSDRPRVRFPG